MPSERHAATNGSAALIAIAALLCGGLFTCRSASAGATNRLQSSSSSSPASGVELRTDRYVTALPRGTKLMLKDGSYELVREYDVRGDRVRYYSVDRSQWEVIPTAIVDWDATKKAEAEEEKSQAALLSKVKRQEDEHDAIPSLDIDASLELAPGVFLPPGDGLFVFDGKSVVQVPQAQTNSHVSKTNLLERVLVPVPIIPSRKVISIPNEHAKFRVNTGQPEFYLRTADARTPDVKLIRAKVSHGKRRISNLDELMGEQRTTSDALPMQQWVVAKDVYRYTLGEKLPRGEYVIAESLPNEGMTMYVWDFGVN